MGMRYAGLHPDVSERETALHRSRFRSEESRPQDPGAQRRGVSSRFAGPLGGWGRPAPRRARYRRPPEVLADLLEAKRERLLVAERKAIDAERLKRENAIGQGHQAWVRRNGAGLIGERKAESEYQRFQSTQKAEYEAFRLRLSRRYLSLVVTSRRAASPVASRRPVQRRRARTQRRARMRRRGPAASRDGPSSDGPSSDGEDGDGPRKRRRSSRTGRSGAAAAPICGAGGGS